MFKAFFSPLETFQNKYSLLSINEGLSRINIGMVSWDIDTDKHEIYIGNIVIMPFHDGLSETSSGQQVIEYLKQALLTTKNTIMTWEAKNNNGSTEICINKKTLTFADITHLPEIILSEGVQCNFIDENERIRLHFPSVPECFEVSQFMLTIQKKLNMYPPVIRVMPTPSEKDLFKSLGFIEKTNEVMVLE